MAKGRNQHVVPRDGGWAVKPEGGQRASSIHGTQCEAIDRGREVPATSIRSSSSTVSTAETKCAKWGRDNVPVGLREKGLEAPVYFRVSVPIYFVVVRSPSFGVF